MDTDRAAPIDTAAAGDGPYLRRAQELLAALQRVSSDSSQGEYYLPDVLPIIRSDGRTVLAHEVSDPGAMMGVNDRAQLARVRALAQARIHQRHMLAGVTIVDPNTTVIDVSVEIAADAVIAPFTSLHGATRVGSGSAVGPLTTLVDTTVGEGSRVLHSYSDRAEIGVEARFTIEPPRQHPEQRRNGNGILDPRAAVRCP